MLNSIPIDIVEIIIIKSFNYKTFQKLQKILIKLKEPSRTARINDKLSVNTVEDYMSYRMNNQYHREYDKPDSISSTRHTWSLYNLENRIDKPSDCRINGHREWCINQELYRNNDYPCTIGFRGDQDWTYRDNNPHHVSHDGFKNYDIYIFHYL